MKKILTLVLCLGLVGCSTVSQVVAPTRENLLKLSIGMTKEEALNTMGRGTATGYTYGTAMNVLSFGANAGYNVKITNPYRSEILQGKDRTFEVIYYVTDVKKDDNAITDDELTPLVFDNGKLIGWGQSFLQDNVQKYEIRMR